MEHEYIIQKNIWNMVIYYRKTYGTLIYCNTEIDIDTAISTRHLTNQMVTSVAMEPMVLRCHGANGLVLPWSQWSCAAVEPMVLRYHGANGPALPWSQWSCAAMEPMVLRCHEANGPTLPEPMILRCQSHWSCAARANGPALPEPMVRRCLSQWSCAA